VKRKRRISKNDVAFTTPRPLYAKLSCNQSTVSISCDKCRKISHSLAEGRHKGVLEAAFDSHVSEIVLVVSLVISISISYRNHRILSRRVRVFVLICVIECRGEDER
jgi:hypothetical protein